jgi:hypothetical protein
MDSIWLPATLVSGLGLAWALLDAWWTRRRWRLDRERRRQALPTAPAPAPAPAAAPAAAPAGHVARPAIAPSPRAEAPRRAPDRRSRADEARESDLPA